VNGELAMEIRREARAPGEFRVPSDPSSGYPVGPWVQFAVVQGGRFPIEPQRFGQQYSVWKVESGASKKQNLLRIRFLADEKARQLLDLGEDQAHHGHRRPALELLERALELGGSAAIFAAAIKTYIELDRTDLARKWASQGRALYPNDQSLTRWNRLLTPPAARTVEITATTKSEEVGWLEANAQQYRGNWVVVARSELLGFGKTLTEALQMARSRGSITGALIHRVQG